MILLKVDKFTTFYGEINKGIRCKSMPCKINGIDSFYVPDGWQEDLNIKGIPFTEIDDSEVEVPTQEINL